jgi:hypothetical protein
MRAVPILVSWFLALLLANPDRDPYLLDHREPYADAIGLAHARSDEVYPKPDAVSGIGRANPSSFSESPSEACPPRVAPVYPQPRTYCNTTGGDGNPWR